MSHFSATTDKSSLRKGWHAARLGDCVTLVNGRAYSQDELLDQGTQVIRIQNLNGGTNWYYSNLNLSEEKYCQAGDLLFAWSASFGPYIWNGPKAIFHYHIWRVLPKPNLDKDFAYHLLTWITESIKSASHGLAMLHMTKEGMENWQVYLPPLDEQKRIAVQLNEQLRHIEKAVLAAEESLSAAWDLPSVYLSDLFNRKEAKKWKQESLGNITRLASGSTPSRGNPHYFDGDITWVKTLDLNFDYILSTQEKITEDAFNAIRGELLPKGTVMVAMYGGAGTIGKSGILGIRATTNQAICSILPNPSVFISEFLHAYLMYIRPEWMKFSGGNRKDPNINKGIVAQMKVPIPDLSIQKELADYLRNKKTTNQILITTLESQLAEINELPSALLRQAFAGEV